MKRVWLLAVWIAFFLGIVCVPFLSRANAQTKDFDYEKATQEAERNRELLEIWKEHVKSLTKERDQAYQELERLKATRGSLPAAQFGAIETVPTPPAPGVSPVKTGSLGGGLNRELQMQLSSLQTQFQQAKKDLNIAKNDKENAIQEKEKALSRVERLQNELNTLKSSKSVVAQNAASKTTDNSAALQKEIDALKEENIKLKVDLKESIAYSDTAVDRNAEVFMRQARALQYENDSLKAQIEKMKVVEKELNSTRSYFSPIVKELQDKNDKLAAENVAAVSEARRVREEAEQTSQQFKELVARNKKLETEFTSLRAEQQDWSAQMESYKAQLQMAAADKDKLKSTEEELEKTLNEFQAIQKAYTETDKALGIKDAELKRVLVRVADLERANREIESRETNNVRSVEKYQAALRANLADMKNLKSNFEAYLESLVASFEERQK